MKNPDLPQEIILEIFTRLDTKTVGRFRTLSKSWKGHLSTSDFVKKHLISRKQTIQQQMALITEDGKIYITTCSDTENNMVFMDKALPGKWSLILSSCDGLLLVDNHAFEMLLVNPITGKQVIIKKPELVQRLFIRTSVYGLGYDSCSNDYKIVRLCSFSASRNIETFVDVYSVKSGVWKRLDGCYPFGANFLPKESSSQGHGAFSFVNGAVHWLIYRTKRYYRSCIAAFDVANEVFREIPLPKEFVRELDNDVDGLTIRRRSSVVSVVGGCLSILDNHGNGTADIWIMKEYDVAESWVKFHIEAEDGKWHSVFTALCASEDGKLLCLSNWDHLLAFDLKAGQAKDVLVAGCDDSFSHGIPFVESLVSPDGSS